MAVKRKPKRKPKLVPLKQRPPLNVLKPGALIPKGKPPVVTP